MLLGVTLGSAARSGPYLPSGWKPQGPAFFLPGEVKETTVADIQVEAEAEGSDALREYGPPKEVSQDLTKQELPEVSTEQAFVVIDLTPNAKENIVEDEEVSAKEQEDNSNIVSEVQQEVDVEVNDTNIQNIADALTNLENEIKQKVVEEEDVIEMKPVEGRTDTQEVPKGFLEYGPPGFKEYGTPKFEDIRPLGTAVENGQFVVEKITPAVTDARRRRFSPKLRLVRKSH